VKILFFGRHFTYFRNFESVLRGLAERGHHIHLAADRDEAVGGLQLVQTLATTYPNVTYGDAPARAADDDAWVASHLRLGLDYLRYQHRIFDRALTLRERSRDRTPAIFVTLGKIVRRLGEPSRRALVALLRKLERYVPEDPAIRAFIASHQPDAVLITPLINLGSSQIEYQRAARGMGIPNALCVWSWDHLSSKALIRDWPDRVFVWNDVQRHEALDLHGVPSDRVVVTGAQCFDQWFNRQPSRDRATFCAHVGLPADRPFVMYACSTLFDHSPPEAKLVVEWIRQVRASRLPHLQNIGILVRPHPSRLFEWDGIDLGTMGPTVLWGRNPLDPVSKADYFDSMYHSAAVVGLITSAFIEAGIVGREVHTLLVPEFEDNQLGTVHYHYLTNTAGGLLTVGTGFEDHLQRLDATMANPTPSVKPFIKAFVRPHGLDVAATPLFVEQVEAMARLSLAPAPGDLFGFFWHWVIGRLRALRHTERFDRWVLSEREQTVKQRRRENADVRAKERRAARLAQEADEKSRTGHAS
jgi:membrane protein YqaA with SNARE-associated domain